MLLKLKGWLEAMYFKNRLGSYIVDHGKSWKKHGIAFLNFLGNPAKSSELSCIRKTGASVT